MGVESALGRLTRDLAIDPGSSNTRVFLQGKGVVVDEPSVVTLQRDTGQIVAVGEEARAMVGRTPGSMVTTRPLKDGAIANYKVAEGMLQAFIAKAMARGLVKPRIAVCVPSNLDDVSRRSFHESARAAGAREVVLLPSSMSAALGCGLPVLDPRGTMVVDIGGGLTEAAVFSLGGIVQAHTVAVGGDALDRAIVAHVSERYGLTLSEQMAEIAKREAGRATEGSRRSKTVAVRGRDRESGMPRQIELNSEHLYAAIAPLLDQIVEAIRHTLSNTPPELAGDILDGGLVLCGGGARLAGMERMIRSKTGLPCVLAENPEHCVAFGAGATLDHPELMERVAIV